MSLSSAIVNRFKRLFFSGRTSLKRIYRANESTLQVAQESRDLLKEIHDQEVPSRLSPELKSLGRQVFRTVVAASYQEHLLAFIYGGEMTVEMASRTWSYATNKRKYSVSLYLRELLKSDYFDSSINLFMVVNLGDSCYRGVYEEFVWNYCGQGELGGWIWPNMFAQDNFYGKIDKQDRRRWETKKNGACFFGASTGPADFRKNDRIQFCLHAHRLNSPLLRAKITKWLQMDPALLDFDYRLITARYASQEEQLAYKIVISIDGNVSSWDRVAWILQSNSLLFKYESEHYDWFYDQLREGEHYVLIRREDDLLGKISYYLKNEAESGRIIRNAHRLVQDHLIFCKHVDYSRKALARYRTLFFN